MAGKLKSSVVLLIMWMFHGCISYPENEITGKWLMHKVIEDGYEVTSDHDPFDERYIVIKKDSTFESGGRPYGDNTGRYIYNATEKTLFLDSDTGADDDSQWKVSIENDTMYWQGFGAEWAERFILIHIRH